MSSNKSVAFSLGRLSALVIGLVAMFCIVSRPASAVDLSSGPASLDSARQAFAAHRFRSVLDILNRLPQSEAATPEARRVKTQALAALSRPKEAFEEYEGYAQAVGREDDGLLEEVAFQFISSMFKDMRDQMRGAAYTAVKELESDSLVPYLEDGLSDGSGLVRALVAEALGQLPKGRQSARLRNAMDDEAAMVRSNVVRAVGLNGNRKEQGFVEQALKDEQPLVRVQAMGALLRLGKKEAWTSLAAAASAANPEARSTAFRVMGDLKDLRGVPLAIAASRDPMPSVRGASAAALGMFGKDEGLEALATLVKDKIPAVRSSAAVALGELETKDAVSVLHRALGDADPGVKGAAVDSLLRLGRPFPEVEPTIRELLMAKDPGPRSAAGKALARGVGPNREAALTYLEQLIRDPLPRPRISAARSIGRIGDRESIPELKHLLRDQDPAVQSTAAASLIRILRAHPLKVALIHSVLPCHPT
ncbi:hypothetical protein YTPLAS18_26570 [Nitrospira sp.]|nr:hypothetical protein YTPLAS18_26570 [Nitrospira sp.]